MSRCEIQFRSVLSRTDLIVVISFSGALDQSIEPQMETMLDAFQFYLDAGAVVLDFIDTDRVEPEAYAAIHSLQNIVRKKGIQVRTCALTKGLRAQLVKAEVLLKDEVANGLRDALFPKSGLPNGDTLNSFFRRAG